MRLVLPIRTVSEANQREHWVKRHKRRSAIRGAVFASLRGKVRDLVGTPCEVTVTRVSPGELDPFDNLPTALKPVVDGIADAFGVDDRSPLLTFRAAQRRAPGYAVEIEITPKGPSRHGNGHDR